MIKRCFVCGNEINTNIDFHGIKIIKDLNKIVSEKYICFKCID